MRNIPCEARIVTPDRLLRSIYAINCRPEGAVIKDFTNKSRPNGQ